MDVRIGYVDIGNWQLFLDRWSGQWVAAQSALDPEEVDEGAEGGRERFGSTARGGGAETTGTPPEGLDPALFGTALFGAGPHGLVDGAGPHLDQDAEIRALDAIAGAFGVTLPRFALRHGRLHAVRGASWTRRPGSGESYVSVSVAPACDTH
ncbi:hypothetical protein OG413_10055 [Streptomyces sp. NBC_01433]|uniref:hypothetical protein n=1 Tax=Streptomyces sp. NBC_01433 TaxID=2903864 RepID=UPI00224F5366|nr:hypothetical protein [Streptomyces sp. NBC_01433]MCX4675647.1 hypothetical protein [Streptomyces sp. NBC_01433]